MSTSLNSSPARASVCRWTWPVPPPLPENAAQQGYRLRVKLGWMPRVWRDLEMRGDQSLEELHL